MGIARPQPQTDQDDNPLLCKFCTAFADDTQLTDFGNQRLLSEPMFARWKTVPQEDPGVRIWDPRASLEAKSVRRHIDFAFSHAPTFSDLSSSAGQGCKLCMLLKAILEDYDSIEHDLARDSLELHLLPTQVERGGSIRYVKIQVRALEEGMLVWKHLCNCLEVSKVTHTRKVAAMKADGPAPLYMEDIFPGIENEESATNSHKKSGESLKFDEDMHRHVPPNPCGEDAISLPGLWLDTCMSLHAETCGTVESQLPTRVIDVNLSDTTRAPFLYIPTAGENGRYVALSYCWGDDMPIKLTTDTLINFQKAIEWTALPKTFQDAIRMTRSLKISYLWIDALCIIQNSVDDWNTEAPRMKQVFQGSHLTISALRAENVHTGLLDHRRGYDVPLPVSRHDQRQFVLHPPRRDFPAALRQSKLSTRGWCFQERIMSPRILYVGPEQYYWECRSMACQEDGVVDKSSDGVGQSNNEFTDQQHIKLWTYKQELPKFDTQYTLWQRAVEMYSCMDLTFETDRLAAISGLAQNFQENGAGPYFWGLWKKDILAGLHWVAYNERGFGHHSQTYEKDNSDVCAELSRTSASGPSGSQAPSWSWMSVKGRVRYLLNHRFDDDILGYNVPLPPREELFSCVVLGIDCGGDNAGNVIATSSSETILSLQAYSADALYMPPNQDKNSCGGSCCGELILKGKDPKDQYLSISGCVMDTNRNQQQLCTCVLLYARNRDRGRAGISATFLVVDSEEETPGIWHRVGFCYTVLDPAKFDIGTLEVSNIRIR